MESPRQLLASNLLGRPVADYIATERAAGKSWRQVARALRDDTGGQIDVTEQTLRTWAR